MLADSSAPNSATKRMNPEKGGNDSSRPGVLANTLNVKTARELSQLPIDDAHSQVPKKIHSVTSPQMGAHLAD